MSIKQRQEEKLTKRQTFMDKHCRYIDIETKKHSKKYISRQTNNRDIENMRKTGVRKKYLLERNTTMKNTKKYKNNFL